MATSAGPSRPLGQLVRTTLVADPDHGWLPSLMLALTVLSGALDAITLLSLGHVFVANMTGNTIFIGLAVGGARGFSLDNSLVALGGFVVGVAAIRASLAARPRGRLRVVRDAVGAEVVLFSVVLVWAGLAGATLANGTRYGLIGLSAAAMGIQNGLVRQVNVPELTTTVVTRTLVGMLWADRSHQPALVRQLGAVISLAVGAGVSAALLDADGRAAAFSVVVAMAAGVTVLAAIGSRSPAGWK